MKTIFSFFVTFIFLQISFAQGPYTEAQRRKDQAKLDSICKKSPSSCLYFEDLIGKKSVFRNHAPRRIVHTNKICFNKKVEYFAIQNGKSSIGCYYINTRDGYVAYFLDDVARSCAGMNNPQPGFSMIITSKIGESFTFRIDNRGRKTFLAQMPIENIPYGGYTNFVLKNPAMLQDPEREPFTNENLPTLGYVIEGIRDSSVKYLFSSYHAQRIPLKDYIGAFGTGYYADEHGNTLICLSIQSPETSVSITKITDVNECFDGSRFDDEKMTETQTTEELLDKKEEALDYYANSATTETCAAANALLAHKRQMLNKERAYNDYIKNGGNVHNREGLRLGTLAHDAKNHVITSHLEVEKKICELENSESSSNSKQLKIACLQTASNQLKELKNAMENIDSRNGTNYAIAANEKNKLYLKKMKEIDTNCNVKKGQIQKNPFEDGAKKMGEQLKEMIKRK